MRKISKIVQPEGIFDKKFFFAFLSPSIAAMRDSKKSLQVFLSFVSKKELH